MTVFVHNSTSGNFSLSLSPNNSTRDVISSHAAHALFVLKQFSRLTIVLRQPIPNRDSMRLSLLQNRPPFTTFFSNSPQNTTTFITPPTNEKPRSTMKFLLLFIVIMALFAGLSLAGPKGKNGRPKGQGA